MAHMTVVRSLSTFLSSDGSRSRPSPTPEPEPELIVLPTPSPSEATDLQPSPAPVADAEPSPAPIASYGATSTMSMSTPMTPAPYELSINMAQNDNGCSEMWLQCGGLLWEGSTCCPEGSKCVLRSDYYSQCVPDMP